MIKAIHYSSLAKLAMWPIAFVFGDIESSDWLPQLAAEQNERMKIIPESPLLIRCMSRSEIDLAVDWAAQEGWNPGLHDAEAFHAADSEGFLVGLIADEPVAVISAVRYERHFGFVGFFIVRPALRGCGFGMQIWRAAMERLSGRTIGLDGVPAQQENYRKSGFGLAHRNVRYQGLAAAGDTRNASHCISLQNLPFAEVAAYDRQFFPAERAAFLQSWVSLPQSFALGAVEGSRLVGYGVSTLPTGIQDRPAVR